MHNLIDYLNEGGYPAKMIPLDFAGAGINGEAHSTASPSILAHDDIVIYPETVVGNPLGAAQVVRFLGNRPYYLTGKGIEYEHTDYVTSYSKAVDPDLPQIFIMSDDLETIRKLRNQEKTNSVSLYLGKVNMRTLSRKVRQVRSFLNRFEKVHLLTRSFPRSREDLLSVLAGSRLLISFDPLSSTSYEATLLNTPVVLMDNSFNIVPKDFNIPLWGFGLSLSEFDLLTDEVARAFEVYEKYLSLQKDLVKKWAYDVQEHFRRVRHTEAKGYVEQRRAFMQTRTLVDLRRFRQSFGGRPLTNILQPVDLSAGLLKMLKQEKYAVEKIKQRTFRYLAKKALRRLRLLDVVFPVWRLAKNLLRASKRDTSQK